MFANLLAVGIALVAGCEARIKFPNARFLGMGYNVIKGNPDNNEFDPGFTYGIMNFTWENNDKTSDGKYRVPDSVQAMQAQSCGFYSQAAYAFGAQSYQKALSTDVNVEGSGGMVIWSARFSASSEYRRVSQETSQYRRFYTRARATCAYYHLAVNYLNVPISMTSDFTQAVMNLPTVRNDSAYIMFINTYGTHFTSRVTMGAKMTIRSEFDETALTDTEEDGLSLEIGAQMSFLRLSGAVHTETKKEEQQRENFEGMQRSYYASYLGRQPPSDGKWETWAQATDDSPYPVQYTLAPLTALFTTHFFRTVPSSALKLRRDLLTKAYDTYCNNIQRCGVPPPDRIAMRMRKVVSTFLGMTWVSCPPKYSLASCGIVNVKRAGSFDMGRYAIPVSKTTCECFDNGGAECVAWCSYIAINFTIATSKLTYEHQIENATCPAGYKVCIKFVFIAIVVS